MFLKKEDASGVANWIWQIVDLSLCTACNRIFLLRSKRIRQDFVVLVVSPQSAVMSEQLNKLEAFLNVCILQSII